MLSAKLLSSVRDVKSISSDKDLLYELFEPVDRLLFRKVTEAVLVFVAIDGSGRTRPVPPRRG